jgi:hypothetical protein
LKVGKPILHYKTFDFLVKKQKKVPLKRNGGNQELGIAAIGEKLKTSILVFIRNE